MISQYFLLFMYIFYASSYGVNSMQIRRDDVISNLVEFDIKYDEDSTFNSAGPALFLTNYIDKNKLEEARQAARVDDAVLLPGIESYSGYLTVNKKYNGNLWFWYFPGPDRELSPLILWLQGGPGASSLFGLFEEIGPFKVLENGTLKENEFSWNKKFSLLFIDNPVGTGFSFTNSEGYAKDQARITEDLYNALQQFLTIFPDMRDAPLFLAGESYAGKYIPSLGLQIHWHKDQDQPINLKGLAIGNGFIDPVTVLRYSPIAREAGLVDDKTADTMEYIESLFTQAVNEGQPEAAYYVYNGLLSLFSTESHLSNLYNYLTNGAGISDSYTEFVLSTELRRAIHVGYAGFNDPETRVYQNLIPDIMNSAKPWLEELLEHYRVLVYSGHLDCMVPYHASVGTYKSLNFSGAEDYKTAERLPWYHNYTLAGYFKKGGNLLEVMVRGAGHNVPINKPSEAFGLITAFTKNISLSTDTLYVI